MCSLIPLSLISILPFSSILFLSFLFVHPAYIRLPMFYQQYIGNECYLNAGFFSYFVNKNKQMAPRLAGNVCRSDIWGCVTIRWQYRFICNHQKINRFYFQHTLGTIIAICEILLSTQDFPCIRLLSEGMLCPQICFRQSLHVCFQEEVSDTWITCLWFQEEIS